MNDYECFCARQRQISETSWIEKVRERLDNAKRSGVTDITTKTGGVLQSDPSLGHYPYSLPPVGGLMELHVDTVVGTMFFLCEDLQCHNLDLTEEQHSRLLSTAEELVRVLKGDFIVPTPL